MHKGFLNAFQLKLIMVLLMVLDHLYYFLDGMPEWFTWLGRLVAPTFCYLMTEGFVHTSNRGRYIRRMLLAGILMYIGNLALSFALAPPDAGKALIDYILRPPLHLDIFLSLAVSAGILYHIERLRAGRSASSAVMLAVLVYLAMYVEGGWLLPVMAVIFYCLRERPVLMLAVYAASCPLVVQLLYGKMMPQVLMVFAVLPILAYNGERGPGGRLARDFFYVVYPLHVWILFAVSKLFL